MFELKEIRNTLCLLSVYVCRNGRKRNHRCLSCASCMHSSSFSCFYFIPFFFVLFSFFSCALFRVFFTHFYFRIGRESRMYCIQKRTHTLISHNSTIVRVPFRLCTKRAKCVFSAGIGKHGQREHKAHTHTFSLYK